MAGKRILLVDDEAALRRLCQRALTDAGHTIDCAADAVEAAAMFGRAAYDVVVTDIVMPDMDGIELIKILRSGAKGGPLKIVAMSGGSDKLPANSALRLSRALGVEAVLFKPFRPAELVDAIAKL